VSYEGHRSKGLAVEADALSLLVFGMFDEPLKCGTDRLGLVALKYVAIASVDGDVLDLNSQGLHTPAARPGLLHRRGRLFGGVRRFLHERHAPGASGTGHRSGPNSTAVTPAETILGQQVRALTCTAGLAGMPKSRGRPKSGVRRSPRPLRMSDRVLRDARTLRLEYKDVLAAEDSASGCLRAGQERRTLP
jgi:hypothetical protein